jgi:cytochrome c biogenesis protein CcmG/thiol:disulfide interchange protein DsbE
MWRFLIPVALFAVLGGFLYKGLYSDPRAIPSPFIGKPAPTFSLTSLEDPQKTIGSADLVGKMYLLNVWSTWCAPCRQEHPALLEIARSGVVPLVGLNYKDDPVAARRFLNERGNPFIANGSDVDGRVGIDWGVYGQPESFLVDTDGTVLFKYISPITPEVWEKEFLPRIQARQQKGGGTGGSP